MVSEIEPVRMESAGSFKYIQIECQTQQDSPAQIVVRGWSDCEYHADILDRFQREELQKGKSRCLGGGRITING